ncbi:SecDF P1 head subdomain-containing protein [Actinomadura chokoriensis]|uniref:SecDF P1 head subdomain domain-containing protein n=1 Tax=Actinomadura chokoriensis TaxID=454156 RepID=A0ABV4R1C6_9ACTN
MRVIPRRKKDRPRGEPPAPAPPGTGATQPIGDSRADVEADGGAPTLEPGRALDPAKELEPAKALGQDGLRGGARPEAATAVLPVADGEAARRRARAAQRHRQAAEVKRSRAGRRPQRTSPAPADATDQHRAALLVMVLTLGLLIAAVAVTGGLIASSMRTRPVTLAKPLHIYPVAQATAGPCPAGTQGLTGQAGTGPTCYHLTQGIAIRKVADLRVQKSRVGSGGYDVAVTLRPVDRSAFARLTRATVGRDLAFVVGERLVTLPRVDMAITDGKVVVTGSPDRATARQLVRDLKGR